MKKITSERLTSISGKHSPGGEFALGMRFRTRLTLATCAPLTDQGLASVFCAPRGRSRPGPPLILVLPLRLSDRNRAIGIGAVPRGLDRRECAAVCGLIASASRPPPFRNTHK